MSEQFKEGDLLVWRPGSRSFPVVYVRVFADGDHNWHHVHDRGALILAPTDSLHLPTAQDLLVLDWGNG